MMKTLKSLIILGAGGHGKVVAETARSTNLFSKIAFLDDKFIENNDEENFMGINIIGKLNYSKELFENEIFTNAIVAIGDSITRLYWLRKLKDVGYKTKPIIHPSAWISPSSKINDGTVVFAQSAIQSNVIIGLGNIINTGSSVDHDSYLEEGVHICPGARLGGNVKVGKNSIIGIGASINKNILIGSNVIIGSGAAVVKNIDKESIALGVPAKVRLEFKKK